VLEKNSKFELFMNRKVVKYIGGVLVLAVFLQLLAIFYLYNTKTIINHIFFGKDLPYLNSLFYYGDLSA
jgi:ABC-type bacteriocin/lantibiotic exporter with double-glycine peptidase domain